MRLWLSGIFSFSLLWCLAQQKVLFSKQGKGSDTYWMLEPEKGADTAKLVVFLHGHGASNPASYGDWLLHLADQKLIVIFPKFQTGAFIPDAVSGQRRIQQNIDSAQAYLIRKYGGSSRRLHFIGHSLGGLLAANLAEAYGASKKYKVASLTLVQPGHQFLKLGAIRSYDHIDSSARIVCVSGSNDRTAGTTFGTHLIANTPHVPDDRKIHFLLDRMEHGKEIIGSTHEEPVCPNEMLDAGNRNPIIRGATLVGKTDLADKCCFWRLADAVLAEPETLRLSDLSDLGKWNDGTPIGAMVVLK